jgi:hypothetical protein
MTSAKWALNFPFRIEELFQTRLVIQFFLVLVTIHDNNISLTQVRFQGLKANTAIFLIDIATSTHSFQLFEKLINTLHLKHSLILLLLNFLFDSSVIMAIRL